MLYPLWQSTVSFYSRFFTNPVWRPSPRQAFKVICEERGEFDDQLIFGETPAELANEAVDCIVTLFGLQMACSGSTEYPYAAKLFYKLSNDAGRDDPKVLYQWLLKERCYIDLDLYSHHHNRIEKDVLDEIAALIDLLITYNIDEAAFNAACERVIDKNNAKTLETHRVNGSGKIARK